MTLANLDNADAVQLELPFGRHDDRRSSTRVIDQVRDRYGTRSINRARLLDADVGLMVPLLPD